MTQDAGLKVKAWEHSAFHSHPYNPKPVLKLQGYHWKKHTNKIFLTVFFHFHLFNAVAGTPGAETVNTEARDPPWPVSHRPVLHYNEIL